MKVRCMMQLVEIAQVNWNPTQRRFKFQCVYDVHIPEHERFYKATPSGDMTMMVDNQDVIASMKLGDYYYFDITPRPVE